MSEMFDAIVVGSGFGGAVTACRLAERGLRVLVLERGRRWTVAEYPRQLGDAWVFNDREPAKQNGWFEFKFFQDMLVVQSAGVGGGSQTYSSAALEAHPSLFDGRWPQGVTYAELKPYYDRVASVMNLQTLPDGQLTPRHRLTREAASALGFEGRLGKIPLALSFSPDWHYGLERPHTAQHSRPYINAHGQAQGTCVHLGHCDVGCEVRAKNTLDLNYIPLAEQHGADVRPLHIVRVIEPDKTGYRVTYDRIQDGHLVRGSAVAARVVLAAGSLGSTELLLRCRDEARTLPKLSRRLGLGWSPNANLLTTVTYREPGRTGQGFGPPISIAIDFAEGDPQFVIEDDGLPNTLLDALGACLNGNVDGLARTLLEQIETHLRAADQSRSVMVWLGSGADAADGELTLKPVPFAPGVTQLQLRWNAAHSTRVIDAIRDVHRRLTEATGGHLPPFWALTPSRTTVTLHPLGGCAMGETAENGVVNHLGEVFGYPGLFVADGAILPSATVRNPSHTIAALAERVAAHME